MNSYNILENNTSVTYVIGTINNIQYKPINETQIQKYSKTPYENYEYVYKRTMCYQTS